MINRDSETKTIVFDSTKEMKAWLMKNDNLGINVVNSYRLEDEIVVEYKIPKFED